ncbi:hypothetical protein MRB53_025538 [Persea americana]|uniref:Uncharacterized protein n=1 Tax=Persea americana TaxID=3435 RepID=A0ACC2LFD9_PERAE|nr:hypothetical protein MRB53_025538 [Persea americana]
MAAAPTRHPAAMYPHLPSSKGPQIRSCHVAVIGAGAAALVAARELCREGHKVVAFESGDSVGGTWVYSPSVDSDPLGLDPYRKKELMYGQVSKSSHNYRAPEPFQDQVVILIGSSASAVDISRDIYAFAKEVHVSSRSAPDKQPASKKPGYDNMWLHSMIESAHDDGTVAFRDGSSVLADVILHCTGYEPQSSIQLNNQKVGTSLVTPFPMFEMQSKWVASVLSGRPALPSQEEMMMDVEAFYSKLDAAGIPKRYTHKLSVYQFDYTDELAAECGYPAVEEWRKQMYVMSWENKVARPESYRDEWDDHSLVLQAHESFQRYCKASI